MEVKKYDHTDLRELDPERKKHEGFAFEFIADVVGDNPDLFAVEDDAVDDVSFSVKLESLGAFGKNDKIEAEASCLWVYFRCRADGTAFLHKLTAYLVQKAKLIDKAKGY